MVDGGKIFFEIVYIPAVGEIICIAKGRCLYLVECEIARGFVALIVVDGGKAVDERTADGVIEVDAVFLKLFLKAGKPFGYIGVQLLSINIFFVKRFGVAQPIDNFLTALLFHIFDVRVKAVRLLYFGCNTSDFFD